MFKFSNTHHKIFTKHGERVHYKKGQTLVESRTSSKHVFFLNHGIVKAVYTSKDGSERIIGFFKPGSTFAQSGSFFSTPTKRLDYIVQKNSEILRVDQKFFFEEIRKNIDFSIDYLESVALNNLYLIERITYHGEKDIPTKFTRWLIFMAKFYGVNDGEKCFIEIPMTQDTISNFLHITRESVNKCMSKLMKDGLITFERKHLTILNLEKLKRLAD